MRKFLRVVAAVLLGCAVQVALAGEVGLQSWGPRVGVSDSPDQVLAGVHFDMGELAPHVRWQPSVEIGFGDHVRSLLGNVLFAYYFQPQGSSLTPYAGGQLTVAYFDPDEGEGDTELGVDAVGGFEVKMRGGTRFLTELQIGFGDIHDLKLMVGWKF